MPPKLVWEDYLRSALEGFLEEASTLPEEHTIATPDRVIASFKELTSGRLENPSEALGTVFDSENCDQMVHREHIRVISMCGHHMLPFIGTAHFAYLPGKYIVGLSKIPRLVHVYARRLQVQERLTNEIVDAFQQNITPLGCGLCIRAYHLCEIVRGVREHSPITTTTALRGSFKTHDATRDEFLRSINMSESVFP